MELLLAWFELLVGPTTGEVGFGNATRFGGNYGNAFIRGLDFGLDWISQSEAIRIPCPCPL